MCRPFVWGDKCTWKYFTTNPDETLQHYVEKTSMRLDSYQDCVNLCLYGYADLYLSEPRFL